MFVKKETSELNRLTVDEFKSTQKIPLVVVLDNIRSQHNVGAVFRTSDAFLVETIYLCGITATPPNREIHKAALGATESVDWRYFEKTVDAVAELKHRGFSVFALEQTQNSISLAKLPELPKPIALILGNEVDGVSEDVMVLVDGALEIPQFGTKHSLNVSVSAGVAIWEMFKRVKG
ncbi:MAG: RNA methyltransferase [Bacteroidales bacterium]|jgi:tRNA G18 (ribose-2'-O)-methylase SpoU|nr:RNA methyltransferase [Bacteroidales bacterium]